MGSSGEPGGTGPLQKSIAEGYVSWRVKRGGRKIRDSNCIAGKKAKVSLALSVASSAGGSGGCCQLPFQSVRVTTERRSDNVQVLTLSYPAIF